MRTVIPAGETQSEGGFKSGKVSSAALLDVQVSAGLTSAAQLTSWAQHPHAPCEQLPLPASAQVREQCAQRSHVWCAGSSYEMMLMCRRPTTSRASPTTSTRSSPAQVNPLFPFPGFGLTWHSAVELTVVAHLTLLQLTAAVRCIC
jgi:hypothetical protein